MFRKGESADLCGTFQTKFNEPKDFQARLRKMKASFPMAPVQDQSPQRNSSAKSLKK